MNRQTFYGRVTGFAVRRMALVAMLRRRRNVSEMKNVRQSIGTGRVAILGIVAAVCPASMSAPTGALNVNFTFDSASSDSVSFDNTTADNLTATLIN